MLFDWFTVLAQIVNFLILLWLLKRFLYKPVLDAIDAREKRIADLLNDTEQHEQQVEQQQQELSDKNAAFATERSELLEQAKAEAESVKQQMLDTASNEVAEQRQQWLAGLQKEQQNLEHNISQRTQHEVFHVARKALQDLSGVELEAQITQVFIKQLLQLSPTQREQFAVNAGAVDSGQSEFIIRSAMPLSEVSQKALQQAIKETFFVEPSLRFEVDDSLVSGIDMTAGGYKFSWNIDHYLSGLEGSIASLVGRKGEASV